MTSTEIEVKKTWELTPPPNGELTIEGAEIMYKNFQGKASQFNQPGDRNFCLKLDPDLAKELGDDGWNIKQTKVRDEGDIPQDYVQISIKYRGRNGAQMKPPKLVLITSRGRTDLSEDDCDILDMIDFAYVDIIVRPYYWEMNGKSGVKAYLKVIYVTALEDKFAHRYRDIPEIDTNAARNMAEEATAEYADDPNIIDLDPDTDAWEVNPNQSAIGSGR